MFDKKLDDKKIKVAIIDSGIDTSKFDLEKYVISKNGFSINDKGEIIKSSKAKISHDHGTAIALIIKNICKEVEFIDINILDESLSTNGNVLIASIEEVIKEKPNIIHLSLGTKRLVYYFSFRKIIVKARKNNIIIVAAADNDEKRCFPAYMKGVIGVKSDYCINKKSYYYNNNFFYACPYIKEIPECCNLNDKEMHGNSFAAAYISGFLANKLNVELNQYGQVNAIDIIHKFK